jgi:hypothetical protein
VELAAGPQRRALAPRRQLTGEDARRCAAPHVHLPRAAPAGLADHGVTGHACPAGQLERHAARRRADLQHAAGRHALERGRQQHLQTPAELEVFQVDAVRYSVPAGARHASRPCSVIAATSDA